jgi:hypothetical protein
MRYLLLFAILLGLQGCSSLVFHPQIWGLEDMLRTFPVGTDGKKLAQELASRGFKIATDIRPPLHVASYAIGGFAINCAANVAWREDSFGKITTDARVEYPCASL